MVILKCDSCGRVRGFQQHRHICECGGSLGSSWPIKTIGNAVIMAHGNHEDEIVYNVFCITDNREIANNLDKASAIKIARRV